MTAYVVTPRGELLIYHEAHFADRSSPSYVRLLTAKDGGKWVADIPREWAVGWIRPEFVLANEPGSLADIKRALRNFDARTQRWRT